MTVDAAYKQLGQSIESKLAELDQLRDRLHLITLAALDHTDGDSQPHDTHLVEIIGIAQGEPNWLRHARINYDLDHARLVTLSRKLVESLLEHFEADFEAGDPLSEGSKQRAAEYMADQLEQDVLKVMFLGEDGRVFLRGRGQPYPPEEDGCPRCGGANIMRVPDGTHPENGDREICGDCGR